MMSRFGTNHGLIGGGGRFIIDTFLCNTFIYRAGLNGERWGIVPPNAQKSNSEDFPKSEKSIFFVKVCAGGN